MLFHINMFVFSDYHLTEVLFPGDITVSDSNNAPIFNLNGGHPSLGSPRRCGIYFRACYVDGLSGAYVGSPSTDHGMMFLQSMEFDYHGVDESQLSDIIMIYGGSWKLSLNAPNHGIFYDSDWQQSFANYHYGSLH